MVKHIREFEMMIYVLAIIVIILVAIFSRTKSHGIPGPWGLPIVGYLPWLNPKAPHITLTELSKKYGKLYGLFLGSVYTVVLSDHRLVRKLFAKEATTGRAPLYLTHGIMQGYGIICSEKELWKDQRKFLVGCFKQFGMAKVGVQREKIETLIMTEISELITYIKSMSSRKNDGSITLDPYQALKHNLGSTINHIVFGKSFGRHDKVWNWLLHLQEEGTKHIGVAGAINFLAFLRFLPKFKRTMNFLIEGKIKTHALYKEIIDEQAKMLEKLRDCDKDFKPDNVLQAFLVEREKRIGDPSEKYYCDEQFFHVLADVFGAGLDTTLTTLRWYFLYMANNPDIQSKVQEEIDAIVQNRQPSLNDLASMPYTEASLAEVQRIRSVVPVGIPHGAIEAIEIDGYTIPKGTMIVPLQWAIHMDHESFKGPEMFDPNRFLDEEGRFFKDERLIPFQTGKRMCIGDEFARMALFLFGTTILKEFFLSSEDGQPLDTEGECGITLTPKAHRLVFTPRRQDFQIEKNMSSC